MSSVVGKGSSRIYNNIIDLNDVSQQHGIENDREFHIESLEWLKSIYIEEGGYHPCIGVPLTLFLTLFHEGLLDLASYPTQPLGELTELENNDLGIEELEQRLNLSFEIVEHAKDIFRDRIKIKPGTKKFNLSINEYVETHRSLALPWAYSSVTIFGGGTPLTKGYLENLIAKRLPNLKETSKKLMQLAIDLLPQAGMHDIDTHFYIREDEIAQGLYPIESRMFTVLEKISERQRQKIPKNEIPELCFSNYYPLTNTTSLITLGTKERTWDIISVRETDPKKIPYLFTKNGLEFPIYDSEGHKIQSVRPQCYNTDPWACIFHKILKIGWLANYIPGQDHPAMNKGLFLKNCIEMIQGDMLPQNTSRAAIDVFIRAAPSVEKFCQEINEKLKHVRKSNETAIALSLNLLELLSDFIKGEPEYKQICINMLPNIENEKGFPSKLIDLIHKYPNNTFDILDVVKGSIIVSHIFQRIAQPDLEMESQVRLSIIDGKPALSYLINGIEDACFSFKIEAKKIFDRIMKIHAILAENKDFLSDLAALHLLCTDSLESRPLPPVYLYAALEKEFDAIELSEEIFHPVILNLANSEYPLCCDMAFHMFRLVKLWSSKLLKPTVMQSLKSSAQLYQSRNLRRTRTSEEANLLAEISEEELRGIILPRSSKQSQRFKQNQASGKTLEREVSLLKDEANKELFDNLLANRNENTTEEKRFHWERITRRLIQKLSNKQVPIKATFSVNTREQFETTVYELLKIILEQGDLHSVVHLFKWSLDQKIFLYDLPSLAFMTESLLFPCLAESLANLLEPIFLQFSRNIDLEAFQKFIDSSAKVKDALRRNFPRLFFVSGRAIDSKPRPDSKILAERVKTVKPSRGEKVKSVQASSDKETKSVLPVKKREKGEFTKFRLTDIPPMEDKVLQVLLMKRLQALHFAVCSRSQKTSKKASLELLPFVCAILPLKTDVEEDAAIRDQVLRLSSDLKTVFIKAAYDAIAKNINNSTHKYHLFTLLYLFWKEGSYPNIDDHYANKLFQKLKMKEERSKSFLGRMSELTARLLKPVPIISGLLLGAGILYGSTILMKKFFSYEDELSFTEELIKDIAVNTIQSVAEHCVTFHLPFNGGPVRHCYEDELVVHRIERDIETQIPLAYMLDGQTYIIDPAPSVEKYHHRLIKWET